jgi:anti-sigma factor RsiW
MNDTRDNPTLLLLHAAVDGELDAIGTMEVEAKLAADRELASEYDRLVALRDAIRARIPREVASDALRARVISMARADGTPRPGASRRLTQIISPYRSLAASLMVGGVLGAGAYGVFVPAPAGDDVQQAIVAGFVRGRLSDQPVDIVTSDRHTVKPWFAGKISGPTTVVDLAADGFPLVGGRIDVVGKTPVPTLVYRRREHQIALSELPAPPRNVASEPTHQSRDGFSLMRWADNSHSYEVVSDLPPAELSTFCAAFRRAATAELEDNAKP